MGGVFISYRRSDSSAVAKRIHDQLQNFLGDKKVFIDIDDIELGTDFHNLIAKMVSNCDVLIAIIGPSWSTCIDSHQNRRIDNPSDYVRLEIAAALYRDIRVVPVFIDGANANLHSENLPDDIVKLASRSGIALRDETIDDDIAELVNGMIRIVEKADRGRAAVRTTSTVEDPFARFKSDFVEQRLRHQFSGKWWSRPLGHTIEDDEDT